MGRPDPAARGMMSKSKPKTHPMFTDQELEEISKLVPLTTDQKLAACIDQARRDQRRISDLERQLAEKDKLITTWQEARAIEASENEQLKAELAEHSLCKETIDGFNEENQRLRDGLRRFRYQWFPQLNLRMNEYGTSPSYMKCVGCGATVPCAINEVLLPKCKPDCWIAKMLEEG